MKKLVLSLIGVFFLVTNLYAGEHLGLDLGGMNRNQVIAHLKKSGAQFRENFGWKGYRNDLPVIKIDHYNVLNRYGPIKLAWLSFSPDQKLYEIYVVWNNTDESFKTIKDALDAKYPRFSDSLGIASYQDVDNNVSIRLVRREADQTTSLTYEYSPALAEVNKMKNLIEEDIKKKNAEKAVSDL